MREGRKWFRLLVAGLACSFALAGCSGDDGKDGVSPVIPGQDGGGVTPEAQVVGISNCATCHGTGSAVAEWKNSPHANQGSHVASCGISCHDPNGDAKKMGAAFGVSASYVVGCEACHGGGSNHMGIGAIPYAAPGADRCGQCHGELPDSHIPHHPYADNITARFETSRHANQSARAALCSACHSHEGGIEFLAMGRQTTVAGLQAVYNENSAASYLLPVGSSTIAGVMKKTCATCHDPHTTELRGDGDVLASATTVTGFPVPAGTAVDGEIRNAYSAEFNLCTGCHMVKLDATWNATAGYNDRGMITYELAPEYASGNLLDAGTGTFDFTKAVFYHDGGSGNGRTMVDTHFGGTIMEHLVKFNGSANDITIKGYNIDPGSANACTICHDPHTGGKMLSVESSSTVQYADQLDNKVVSYAEGLGDFHTNYLGDAFSRNQTGASCTPCHTGNKFVSLTVGGALGADERWNTVGCRSCHDLAVPNAAPGANNAAAFAKVREFPAGYEFKFNNANAAVVTAAELGVNQICFECHKGRIAGADVVAMVDEPAGTTNYAISYLHYAPSMAILFGNDSKMVATYPSKQYAGRFQHWDGAKFGCVDCHDVHNTQGNNVVLNKMTTSASCKGCHEAGKLASVENLQARTLVYSERLLDAIYDDMIVAANGGVPDAALNAALKTKLVEIFNAPTAVDGKNILMTYIQGRQSYFPNKTIAQAVATWKIFTYEDGAPHGQTHGHGGSWAHNSKFARQVMFDAIESLGGNTTGLARPL